MNADAARVKREIIGIYGRAAAQFAVGKKRR